MLSTTHDHAKVKRRQIHSDQRGCWRRLSLCHESSSRIIKEHVLRVIAALILSFTCLPPHADATTLKPLSLGQLTRLSGLIARGVVTHKEVIDGAQGSLWTTYHVRLLEVWHGAHYRGGEVIRLTLRGGILGEGITQRGQMIPAQPQLTQDQEGVFFLERAPSGQLVFAGMNQGWFSVIYREGSAWASRDPTHRAHLLRNPSVQPFADAPTDPDLMPLSMLRRLVKHGAKPPRALRALSPSSTTPQRLHVERRGR